MDWDCVIQLQLNPFMEIPSKTIKKNTHNLKLKLLESGQLVAVSDKDTKYAELVFWNTHSMTNW